jgi:hypothetical protein
VSLSWRAESARIVGRQVCGLVANVLDCKCSMIGDKAMGDGKHRVSTRIALVFESASRSGGLIIH